MQSQNCPLCAELENVIWENDFARVLFVLENSYPILRVVLKKHVQEMSDLAQNERAEMMKIVFACEAVFREILKVDKINLASLGNVVSHVHWHVIARFQNDAHFPDSIWAAPRRDFLTLKIDRAALQCALIQKLKR